MIWARRTLADNWDATPTIKEDHKLIQSGPYSLARHPIYTGLFAQLIGCALTTGELRGILWLPLLLGYLRKTAEEERILMATFPEYAAYSRRVKRFIPFIY